MSARRIPRSHGCHITGWHPVRPGHEAVPFESGLERDTVTWLTQWSGFQAIVAQPITLRYAHPNGYFSRYTPDYRVTYTTLPDELQALGFRLETYIEVKYAAEASDRAQHLTLLSDVIRRQTGRPLVILTEREVRANGKPRHR